MFGPCQQGDGKFFSSNAEDLDAWKDGFDIGRQVYEGITTFCACFSDGQDQVINHHFKWWFNISPPKGYYYCSPRRAVSQALLLAPL